MGNVAEPLVQAPLSPDLNAEKTVGRFWMYDICYMVCNVFSDGRIICNVQRVDSIQHYLNLISVI